MEFKLKKNDISKSYYEDQEMEIARTFAKKVHKEIGTLAKAIVLFGSHAKRKKTGEKIPDRKSDIDILVIIDDVTVALSKEATESYKIIMKNILVQTSDRLHLTTLAFGNFWDLVRNGDPVVINMLRDGVSLIDTGVFDPLQALLYQGKIRPTWESIWTYYTRAPNTLMNSRWHLRQAVLDLYWAVIDSAHAALMKIGEIPPSPAHVADLLEEKMYRKGLITKRYVTIMRNFHQISKHIMKSEIKDIHGNEYEKHYKDAKDFVDTMKKIIDKR